MASKKKLQVWLPILFSLAVILGMFVGYRIKGNMPNRSIFYIEKQRPVQEVLDLIGKKYVDTVNVDSLGNLAIQTILSGLDPHSVYIPANKLQEINDDMEGFFWGIGIEFSILSDTTVVLQVMDGGPAQQAGLKLGDQIIRVNDSLIAGNHTSEETLKGLMRGKGGSVATLQIRRDGSMISKDVKRGPVKLSSIDAAYMVNDTTGFIRINKFSETTYKEFMGSMDSLINTGMKALILDLRDNGGGIFTEAIHIADEFLDDNKLITYTAGANLPKKEYRSDKKGIFEKGRLVVLINEGTASASEVLAGALQDWGRATIIGRRSFGKGLVQEQYQLSDGSALRLTVARYYTPLGRSIQRSYSEGSEAYYHEIIDRVKHGELESADSIKHDNLPEFRTAAGRILYGGDGITPDIFVPIDSAIFEKPVMKALVDGVLDQFIIKNYFLQKNTFDHLKTLKEYITGYTVNDSTLHRFDQFAKKDTIAVNLKNPNQKHQLELQIKLLTGRMLWGTNGFFELKNPTDSTFIRSLDVIGGKDTTGHRSF